MHKDFDKWNEKKKKVNNRQSPFYHEREIWWCILGINVGFEQDGSDVEYYRPTIVIKSLSRNTCLVVPLTTSLKTHKFRLTVGPIEGKRATALLSQIKTVDVRRLFKKIGTIDQKTFEDIRKAIRNMF